MAEDGGNAWSVVVLEIAGTGNNKIAGVGLELPARLRYADAVREAERIALEHRPQHPMTPRERRVYREDERRWLVIVEGAGRPWPFEVRVVQAVPSSDGLAPGAVV